MHNSNPFLRSQIDQPRTTILIIFYDVCIYTRLFLLLAEAAQPVLTQRLPLHDIPHERLLELPLLLQGA